MPISNDEVGPDGARLPAVWGAMGLTRASPAGASKPETTASGTRCGEVPPDPRAVNEICMTRQRFLQGAHKEQLRQRGTRPLFGESMGNSLGAGGWDLPRLPSFIQQEYFAGGAQLGWAGCQVAAQ